jgi:hypothetical protein
MSKELKDVERYKKIAVEETIRYSINFGLMYSWL